MKSSNCCHIKSRSILKQAQFKVISTLKQHDKIVNIMESQRKNAIKYIPSKKIDISSLTTSRENSTEASTSHVNRSFLIECPLENNRNEPTIKIEEKFSVEGHSCDPSPYIKTNMKLKGEKQLLIHKAKITKLKKENEDLKKKMKSKDEILKKYNEKRLENIKYKMQKFAVSLDNAIEKVQSFANNMPEFLVFNNKCDTSINSDSSDSSLVTVLNYGESNSIISNEFMSPKNSKIEKGDLGSYQKPIAIIKEKKGTLKLSFSSKKMKSGFGLFKADHKYSHNNIH